MQQLGSSGILNQSNLEAALRDIFKGEHILTDVRKDAEAKSPATGSFLQIDIWIPKLKICFEFQDSYHYTSVWYSHHPLAVIMEKDYLKREVVHKQGATLIQVPVWWDGSNESLIASVNFYRPDLLADRVLTAPFPLAPPTEFFGNFEKIPDVGELMLASFPITLSFSRSISSKNSWWMGEKYDGIRFCWNPIKETLYARSGLVLPLSPSFLSHFNSVFHDGEFWFGKGYFMESIKMLSTDMQNSNWPYMRAVVFDEANPGYRHQPFEERYSRLLKHVPSSHPFIAIASRHMARNRSQLTSALHQITNEGGEGVILRQPLSTYEPGRSTLLLKLKASRGDREALIVDIEDDSYVLQLPEGNTFKIPIASSKYEIKPKIGNIVTFTYENFSRRSVPIAPKIFRIRTDVSWEQVLASEAIQAPNPNFSSQKAGFSPKPLGFWNSEKGKNMRLFFEKYAKRNNFDPLVPENWYPVLRERIFKTKGGPSVLSNFKGSLIKSLCSLFPDVKFIPHKFAQSPINHWTDATNRKQFFDTFAKEKGFDPLIAENWYKIGTVAILESKGGSRIQHLYNGLHDALMLSYPDIGIDKTKFIIKPRNYWSDKNNQKKFFLKFAKRWSFNPFIASNWYAVKPLKFVNTSGGGTLLKHFKGGFTEALMALFPDIGLEKSKFNTAYHFHAPIHKDVK